MILRALLLLVLSFGWWRVPRTTERNRQRLLSAALLVCAAMIVLALVATPLIDVLDVDAETWRIATGLALVVAGAFRMFGAGARVEDGEHTVSWVVPLAYPVLFGPETALMAISAGADHGVWLVAAAAACGVALTALAARKHHNAVLAAVWVRTGGVAVVLLAVTLIFDGLRSI